MLRVWQKMTSGITKSGQEILDPAANESDYDSSEDDEDEESEKKDSKGKKKKEGGGGGGGGLFKKIERAKILGEVWLTHRLTRRRISDA